MMTKRNGIIVLFTAFTMVLGLATNSPVSYAEENGNSLNAVDENRFSELVEGFHENDFIRAGEYVEALPNFSELSLEELDVLVANYMISNLLRLRSTYLPPTAYGGLNAKEVALAKNHPFEATQFYGSSQVAINYTKTKFGRNGFQDASDAFRHAMWNGNLTQRIGASRAKVWTDAHEAYSSGIDKQMDLHNNQLGRTIGKNYGSTNPGINVKNMADKMYSEIKAGKGKVIKNNKLVSSKF